MKQLILEAEYADIIISLINEPFKMESISKLIFTAFCIRHEEDLRLYGNRKYDIINTFLRNINIKLMTNVDDIRAILSIIEKLEKNKFIKTREDEIFLIEKTKIKTENSFIKSMAKKQINVIDEINKISTRAFVEEVLNYV